MRVICVAETKLSVDEETFAILQTGYTINEWQVTDIDDLHEAAGRGCYESWSRPNPATATNADYLSHITDVAHFSVTEHGSLTLWVEGVSRNLLLELTRHQLHSNLRMSVLSTRYVNMSQREVVEPPLIEQFDASAKEAARSELARLNANNDETYTYLRQLTLDQGFTRKQANGVARAAHSGNLATNLFASGDIRCWRDIVLKRDIPGAEEEIQQFAQEVLKVLRVKCPNSVSDIKDQI